jgi:hypothetical protein
MASKDIPLISLSEHPRAAPSIRRVKAWGGLLAFVVTGFASHAAGMGLDGAAFRALGGGVLGYLLSWWLAVVVWRNLLRAEAKAAIERATARRAELTARTSPGSSDS